MVQFYPWFKVHFPLFLGMVIYDNEFETKDKIEPQHIHLRLPFSLQGKEFYYINTNEMPGELSRENLVSSHEKITCYLHI